MRPTNKEIKNAARAKDKIGYGFDPKKEYIFEEGFRKGAKWYRDNLNPWYYTEDGDFPELYEDENGQIKSDYVWVKCTDGEYDEASLRKPSNLNMFWDFINDHEINGEVTDIADDVYKVKCWMYPIEPKR